MIAQGTDGIGTAPAATLGHAISNDGYRMVQPDAQGVRRAFQLEIAAFTLHVGAKASNPGENGLSGFGMVTDKAGQADKLLGHFQIQLFNGNIRR